MSYVSREIHTRQCCCTVSTDFRLWLSQYCSRNPESQRIRRIQGARKCLVVRRQRRKNLMRRCSWFFGVPCILIASAWSTALRVRCLASLYIASSVGWPSIHPSVWLRPSLIHPIRLKHQPAGRVYSPARLLASVESRHLGYVSNSIWTDKQTRQFMTRHVRLFVRWCSSLLDLFSI